MKNLLFLLAFAFSLSLPAQTSDSTCAAILKVQNMLRSKDGRAKLKGDLLTNASGPISRSEVFRSTVQIPGMSTAVISEGFSSWFRAYITAGTYEEAVKQLKNFNERMHGCFGSGYTFTESNESRELYKSYKVVHDKDLLGTYAVKYYLERQGETFRLVLELVY